MLFLAVFWGVPVSADDAPLYESTGDQQQERAYSAWERRIAQEVIATGQMLEGDPRFDHVVSALAQRGQSLLPDGGGVTQDWVRKNLRDVLPEIDNKMAAAAMNAVTGELARGTGDMANGFARSQIGLSGDEQSYDLGGNLKQTALRGGLEGVKAAAAASHIYALNHLELEYSLSSGGIDEYSALTVQPLWDSIDLRHTVFAQASYANKEVSDIGATTSGRRDTVNAGLAYRYITPDAQHMFGANLFFDHQWPYHHNRMSLGLDYKTSLYGVAFNKYIGLSDWRGREDGYEEKALGGEDLEVSGRVPQAPELEVFAKGYHWGREKTPVLNPDGDDIWGYQFAAEYTPVNGFTIRSQATKDNEMNKMEGQITLRLNYRFGQGWDDLWKRPTYNLESVLDRRLDKVSRQNEIRVQVRQDPDVTARVPATIILGLTACPTGDLTAPADAGCARLFGADPTDTDDVMIYAGDVPGTTTDFFVRRCDLGQDYDPVDDRCENGGGDPNTRDIMRWKDANTESDTTNIGGGTAWTNVNATDGPGNTATLVADVSGTHTAAETCNALPGGGWYLPALSELDVIYANLNATDDPDHPLPTVNDATEDDNSGTTGPLRDSFDLSGQWYWSSSEFIASRAWIQRFSDGSQTSVPKTNNRDVRCARR